MFHDCEQRRREGRPVFLFFHIAMESERTLFLHYLNDDDGASSETSSHLSSVYMSDDDDVEMVI